MTQPHSLVGLPETEPFLLDGNGVGILLLHGFTSTPQSVHHVGHALHCRTGATVGVPLLAGHGTTPDDLARTSQRDWIASAEDALDALRARCRLVMVAGLSLGGTLALNLAARHPDCVDAVVTINGSTGLYRPETALPLFDADAPTELPGIGSDIRHPDRREICYDRIPNVTLRERILLTAATGSLLPLIRQPILVIQSRTDHVVDPANAYRIVRDVSSDEVWLRWLNDSWHVATLDHDRDRIAEMIAAFVASQISAKDRDDT